MIPKPSSCVGCPLHELDANGFVRAEGTGSLGVLLIGEAGGESERKDGLPFRPYAQAGSQLEAIIKLAGFQRQQFRLSNAVNCQPPNSYLAGAPYEFAALEHCRIHRERIIREMKPKCILALGEIAFRTLTGLAGPKQTISYMRGYVLESTYGIPVIGTYHPSYIKRGNQKFIGVCINDLQRAVQVARNGTGLWPVSVVPKYTTSPTLADAQRFYEEVRQHPERLLSYDIETPWSGEVEEDKIFEEEEEQSLAEGYNDAEITTVQFSLAKGSGICLPFIEPFISIIRAILALPNEKVAHNGWRFDNPRLKKAQIKIEGVTHDSMWAFHHLQPDLVGHFNLQSVASFYDFPFPWKHLNHSDPGFYGCADVDSLQYIWPRLRQQMIDKGVWRGYERQVLGLEPILVGMSKRGIPVDDMARIELGSTLETQQGVYKDDMQRLVSQEVLICHPKQGYKRTPKDIAGLVKRTFYLDDGDPFGTPVERWCRLESFTPSSKQVIAHIKYMAKNAPDEKLRSKYVVAKNIKTGKDTSDLKALEKLFKETGDPLVETILKYRGVEKIIGTYVNGWRPNGDGRVHPEFLYKPATGQLSSINPNAQNVPAGKGLNGDRAALARQFRRIIRAERGHKLIEFDWKSFHGCTMGFEARDSNYIRLARLGMHDFLTSYMMKEPARFDWPDDQLKDYLGYIKKKYKQVRDVQAKPAILGMQFGEEAYGLHKRYPDSFPKVNSAEHICKLMNDLFPGVAKYKEAIMRQAHSKRYLISQFGYIRWFWNVFNWDSKLHCLRPAKGSDGDANKCKAFLPANDAFGHKKEVLLHLHENRQDERYGLINDIHDALMFHCLSELVEECISVVKPLMEAPSKILVDPLVAPGGLWVEVETKVGLDWSEMEETD